MSNTKNFGISIFIILITCLLTVLILQNISHNKISSRQKLYYRSDAFIRNANYYQYDKQGSLHSYLHASLIIHFPYKDSFQFSNPHCFIYTNKHILWNIIANTGKSQHGMRCIFLQKNVKIYELQQSIEPKTIIATNTLTLFPNCSFAKTNDSVTITQPNTVVQAVGMTANLKNGLVHLLSSLQGVYKINQIQKTSWSHKDHKK